MSQITDDLDAYVVRLRGDGFPTALIERTSQRMKDMEKEIVRQHREVEKLERTSIGVLRGLRGLLKRCLPIVQADAQMMADITRHAPLDPESQAKHDSTEYESEKLLREIPEALKDE